MDVRTQQDVAATAAVHSELGHDYEGALAEGLVERISSEIDKQVDARLAQRGVQPSRTALANVAMGLGSVGLGIGATAVTLHSLSTTGTVPKAAVDFGPFHASVMSTTSSISTAQVLLVVLIWVVIAVINVAYARRRSSLAVTLCVPSVPRSSLVHWCHGVGRPLVAAARRSVPIARSALEQGDSLACPGSVMWFTAPRRLASGQGCPECGLCAAGPCFDRDFRCHGPGFCNQSPADARERDFG